MRILLLFCLCGLSSYLSGQCVFISEYIEGSGNNKCIEIYNGTGANVDLAAGGYQLEIYSNGSATASATILLTGILLTNDVYVVCNSGAIVGMLAQADLTVGSMNFNGNDAVRLLAAGTTLDVIGQIGTDPGTEWNGLCCTDGTQNGTLMRKPYLGCPSFDGSSVFDPDMEWDCAPEDSFSDLGNHSQFSCAIDKLTVSQIGCNNGIATIAVDFIAVPPALSTDFQLTVTPSPSGVSGVYPYASTFPLIHTGFVADNSTQYDFSVADDFDPSCLSQQLLDLTFDCPVADALSFEVEPLGCIETDETFSVQVCAIQTSSGGVQPDYSQSITLSLNGAPAGTLTGALTAIASNGCATFSFSYDAAETISFSASDGTLVDATSSNFSFAEDCPALNIYTGLINPCGDDSPNELIAMSTGIVPVDVQDIVFASIDPAGTTQPEVRHTWSASSADIAGSTYNLCGSNPSDIKCHRIMDISNPTDLAIISPLLNSLNTQAGCTLFALPLGAGMGTIPANHPVVMFLGAGGNQSGTILSGFDGLGSNLDFSTYCTYATVYVIFGQHVNTISTFGFYSNDASRTYQVSIAGDITDQLTYTTPSAMSSPENVTESGGYTAGGNCTPGDLFGDFVLGELFFDLSEDPPETNTLPMLHLFPNPVQKTLHLDYQLSLSMNIRLDIYSAAGAIVSSRSLESSEGLNSISLDVSELAKGMYHIRLHTPISNCSGRFLKL